MNKFFKEMRTIKNIFLAIISGVMVVASCAKIDSAYNDGVLPKNNKGEYAILFNNSSVFTKAAVSPVSSKGYDEFSLFAWNSNNDTIMNPYVVQPDGADAYKYDGIGEQKLQYFKNNAESYSFIGVIPTTDVKVKNGAVKVGVESFVVDDKRVSGTLAADSPKEFLWARTDVTKANYNQTVSLPFKHGNALLYLGFVSDDGNTQIVDYTPHVDAQAAQPAVPGTETYTKKTTKFIDELVAGNEVQVAIGFYGVNSPKLTKTNPNPLYVGADNTSNGYLAKTWLLSIKDAVNAQFVYYRLNAVANSTSKTVTTEDWESAASNKNIFMMKLADGVDKAAFAAGNDAFATALKTHQTDWVGGSPAESFWAMFEQAYADGWRVVRINVSDANASQVLVFLSSNIEASTQVCEVTGGSPAVSAIPESGFKGIRVFSAKADATDGYAHLAHTKTADATVATALTFDNRVTVTDSIQFSLPGVTVPVGTTEAQAVYSPTTFYAIPGDTGLTHFVVKLSYTYKGTTVYDVRVPITLPAAGLEAGKYYKYIINITSTANGTNDPDEANTEKDDISIIDNPIQLVITVDDYTEGDTQIIKI